MLLNFFLDKYQYNPDGTYNKKKIRIKNINDAIKDYNRNNNLNNLITEYNSFNNIENFVNDIKLNKIPNPNDTQKKLYNYWKELDENIKKA